MGGGAGARGRWEHCAPGHIGPAWLGRPSPGTRQNRRWPRLRLRLPQSIETAGPRVGQQVKQLASGCQGPWAWPWCPPKAGAAMPCAHCSWKCGRLTLNLTLPPALVWKELVVVVVWTLVAVDLRQAISNKGGGVIMHMCKLASAKQCALGQAPPDKALGPGRQPASAQADRRLWVAHIAWMLAAHVLSAVLSAHLLRCRGEGEQEEG